MIVAAVASMCKFVGAVGASPGDGRKTGPDRCITGRQAAGTLHNDWQLRKISVTRSGGNFQIESASFWTESSLKSCLGFLRHWEEIVFVVPRTT